MTSTPTSSTTRHTLARAQFNDAGSYSANVSNPAGGANSSNAVVNIGIASAISAQPQFVNVTQGQNATFNVTATGTPLNYFWRRNGAFIPGATNASLTLTNVTAANGGIYTVVVSNFLGNVTSTGAVLTVLTPPAITTPPASLNVGVGSDFTLSVAVSGSTPLFYQWYKNGTNLPSATGASFAVVNAQLSDSGGYFVVVTNTSGSATSIVAQVSVGYSPVFTAHPVSQTNLLGGAVTFSGAVTGSPPLAL